MNNPFEKKEITLSVSQIDLELLLKCLSNSIPSQDQEMNIIYLYGHITRKLDEIKKV